MAQKHALQLKSPATMSAAKDTAAQLAGKKVAGKQTTWTKTFAVFPG